MPLSDAYIRRVVRFYETHNITETARKFRRGVQSIRLILKRGRAKIRRPGRPRFEV